MVDKVMEIAKKILERVKEWWNKFKPKQKTLIICVAAGVLIAISILVGVLTRKQYKELVVCESTKEASQIRDLLDGQSLDYKVSEDGLSFQILNTQMQIFCWEQIIFQLLPIHWMMYWTAAFLQQKQISRNVIDCIWKARWKMTWRAMLQ